MSYLANTEEIRTGAGDPEKRKEKWSELASELNAFGAGSQKTAGEWETTFKAWKNAVRFKARSIRVHEVGTGGGPPSDKKLSDIEERALQLWGREAIDGFGLGSHGLSEPHTSEVAEPVRPAEVPVPPKTPSKPRPQPKRTEEVLLEALQGGDEAMASAINHLADSLVKIGEGMQSLAAGIAQSNNNFQTVITNQNNQISMMIQLLQQAQNPRRNL